MSDPAALVRQAVAERKNRNSAFRRAAAVDVDAGPRAKAALNPVASHKHARSPRFERAIDAKPYHDPDSPELHQLIRRLERQNRRRERQRAKRRPA